ARMLADYLQFMKDHGFAIDILGINCEPEGNEGVFTAAKHKETIDELRRLSKSLGFSFVMPSRIVCPNTIDPGYGYDKEGNAHGAQFIKELNQNGWGDRLDVAGTHYYHGDAWRPRSDLDDFCREAGDRPKWNTEVHWKDQGADVMANAEKAMAGVFDCIDAGMTGFVWWSYRREETDLKSSLIHRLTLSTLGSRPIDVDDVDGRGMKVAGQLITRGFRKGLDVTLWVINNNESTAYTPYRFNLATKTISGEVAYKQWTATAATTGAATRLSDAAFAADIPAKTITEITFSLAPGAASQSLGKTGALEE
ncbi:MAG: hypothetical protein NTW86_24970, partial [Candidatus Sumerlaeota bacterium]|nr:hypothetical protein [Candidatus Sumerlaeota bacterium]